VTAQLVADEIHVEASMVMTVRGEVGSDQLGITMSHEHLIIDRYPVTRDFNKRLSEVPLAVRELVAYAGSGGSTLVELTVPQIGRNPLALRAISEETGVNIVMGCGWYHEEFYKADNYEKSTDSLATELVNEIRDGVGDAGVRPGIIGELGTGDTISPAEERAFRAAARAHLTSGLTISTHAFASYVGQAQVSLLREEGVPAQRIVVGHLDSVVDPAYHEAVAALGVWIQFDLIRSENEWEISKRIELVKEVIKRGYAEQLLLSQDTCMKSHLKAYGGRGYDSLLSTFVQRLSDAGLTESDLCMLLVENPKRMLTGDTRP
jgi:predicted metal-dependent phosphotriesterase family hydrolase